MERAPRANVGRMRRTQSLVADLMMDPAQPNDTGCTGRSLSKRRRWIFRLLAVCLAISPVLIGELICRYAGYGGYPPVLKPMHEYAGTRYVGTFQPGVNTFFWQNLSSTGSMEEHVFVTPKPKGRRRIMTFGGSAMRGFPQPRPLVSTSFLQAMLEDVWPDRDIEVLNFGTTAVASFPVMYILDEALEYEPDLVVIYSGNNEFYGACGVASLHSFGQSTWSMNAERALRWTGLGQWIADVRTQQQADSISESAVADERSKSLMESVIADGQIGPDDPRRTAAADNLRRHLTTMVEACRARGVPVIICTLPANERDMAPLGRDAEPALSPDGLKQFNDELAASEAALSMDPAGTLRHVEAAEALESRHAKVQYLLGQCLSALDRHEEAAKHFRLARENDPMPWRAPESLCDVVRQVAKTRGAVLCDLERSFQSESPGGAIGWELMDDHVHPTLRGQALIAESIVASMDNLTGDMHVDLTAKQSLPSWETYAASLGDNAYDRFGVQHRMRTLFRAPFYAESNPLALQRSERLCIEYRKDFSEPVQRAIDYWQKPETHSGGFRPITGFVGAVLLSEGKYAEADRILCVARKSVAEYSLWNLELTWKALSARRHLRERPTPEDMALAREMIEDGETMYRATGIRNPELCRHLGLVYHLIGEHEKAIPDLNTALKSVQDLSAFEVVQALVDSLMQTGQRDKAIAVLKSPIKNPQLADACKRLLQQLEASSPRS